MNIIQMMIPKPLTFFLHESNTVRQGLETFRHHGYTAVPVLDESERYVGCVTEGDFLRLMMRCGTTDLKTYETHTIAEIVRKDFLPALQINAAPCEVLEAILNHNFVPIVDDRDTLSGILTRKSVIEWLADRYEKAEQLEREKLS